MPRALLSPTCCETSQSWHLHLSPKPFQCLCCNSWGKPCTHSDNSASTVNGKRCPTHRGLDFCTHKGTDWQGCSMYWNHQKCEFRNLSEQWPHWNKCSLAVIKSPLQRAEELGHGLIDCPQLNSVFGCDVVVFPQQARRESNSCESCQSYAGPTIFAIWHLQVGSFKEGQLVNFACAPSES